MQQIKLKNADEKFVGNNDCCSLLRCVSSNSNNLGDVIESTNHSADCLICDLPHYVLRFVS